MTLARWTQPSGPLCLWQCFIFRCTYTLFQNSVNIIFATSVKCTNCKGNKILLGPSVIVMTAAQSLSVSVTATKCRQWGGLGTPGHLRPSYSSGTLSPTTRLLLQPVLLSIIARQPRTLSPSQCHLRATKTCQIGKTSRAAVVPPGRPKTCLTTNLWDN